MANNGNKRAESNGNRGERGKGLIANSNLNIGTQNNSNN